MKSKFLFIIASCFLLYFNQGCTDNFEEINTDPNRPSVVSPEFLLTSAQSAMGNAFTNLDIAGSVFTQQIVAINTTYNIYQLPDIRDNAFKTFRPQQPGLYDQVLMELQELIEVVNELEAPSNSEISLSAVARILKVFTFQLMTDYWGDIPYSKALKGTEILSVPYDTQESIYIDLLDELDASIALLTTSGGAIEGDIIYGGNIDNWILFANSLKLRAAMRMSEVAPSIAQAAAVEAVTAGVITSNSENALVDYIASANQDFAGRFTALARLSTGLASNTIIDLMQANNDPRIPYYFNPGEDSGGFTGVPHGLRIYAIAGEVSSVNLNFTGQSADYFLITAEEMLLLQAEMAWRGWITEDAETLYNQAIQLSLEKFGAPTSIIDVYLSEPSVIYDANKGLEQIATQKWLSLFMQGVNAWAEWRRLGFPILSPAPEAVNNITQIPTRMVYPINEQFLNTTAYQEAVDRLGSDEFTQRVWWDIN